MVTLFDQEKILELHDHNVAKEARNEGYLEGFREGFQERFQEGFREGIAVMALRMLETGKYALEDIAELTDMAVDEIRKLQTNRNA